MKITHSLIFVILGLCTLIIGAFAGILLSLVYMNPAFFKELIPFNQLRPLHTTSVVSWIILTATGGIYYYLIKVEKIKLYSSFLSKTHLYLFFLTGLGIYYSFISGKMGGREYLEFFPVLTFPILIGWALFGFNYFASLLKKIYDWPVYFWMWGTGIVFMTYHLSEAHFWIFNSIREDFIKDLTIQWKSYGSFVGSWNLLVYGTAIYIMSKIKNNIDLAKGKKVFFFFFLGLANLMFGWAHHTYLVPSLPWIRYVAYGISMTEWIVLINIIYCWSKSLTLENKKENSLTYKFLISSEFWVFLNLILALLISIPSINYYTHGTHITVAHSMGTTIGINSMILFASVSFILRNIEEKTSLVRKKYILFGYYLLNISLFIFWITLIVSGILKAVLTSEILNKNFQSIEASLNTSFIVFFFSGLFLFLGILVIALPMIDSLSYYCFSKKKKEPV